MAGKVRKKRHIRRKNTLKFMIRYFRPLIAGGTLLLISAFTLSGSTIANGTIPFSVLNTTDNSPNNVGTATALTLDFILAGFGATGTFSCGVNLPDCVQAGYSASFNSSTAFNPQVS